MANKIDILVVEPGEAPRPAKVEDTLEAFQQIVGCQRRYEIVRACLKSPPRMSWRRIFRPDCVKNPCHPSGCLRIFALQGKKSTRQSIHVKILNRL